MAHIHTAKIEDPDFVETYTACIQQNGDGWMGWIRGVPEVKCEERTRESLLKILEYEPHKTLVAEWEAWSAQFEEDVKAGRLDPLREEALDDLRAGRCSVITLPAIKNFHEKFNNSPTRNLNY